MFIESSKPMNHPRMKIWFETTSPMLIQNLSVVGAISARRSHQELFTMVQQQKDSRIPMKFITKAQNYCSDARCHNHAIQHLESPLVRSGRMRILIKPFMHVYVRVYICMQLCTTCVFMYFCMYVLITLLTSDIWNGK